MDFPVVSLRTEFFLLIAVSLVLPVAIYMLLFHRKSISRGAVAGYGTLLITLAGANVYLLQRLSAQAGTTPNTLDDKLFASELSVALYLLPAVFAGIGVNLLSHALISHLTKAEQRYEQHKKRETALENTVES